MNRKPYPSDLTDAQWQLLEPLLPPARPGSRPRKTNLREAVNAIFYLNREGCTWRALPHDFPPWRTVYEYFADWKDDGTWEAINGALRRQLREAECRAHTPTTGSLDSQTVKDTDAGRGRRRPSDLPAADLRALSAAAGGTGGQRLRPLRAAGVGGAAGPLPADAGEAAAGSGRLRAAAGTLGGGADVRLAGPLPAAQPRLRAADRVE